MFIIIPYDKTTSFLIHNLFEETLYFQCFGVSSLNISRDYHAANLADVNLNITARPVAEADLPDAVKNALTFYKVNGHIV